MASTGRLHSEGLRTDMARDKSEGPVTLSVLDRLIDEEPKSRWRRR